MARIPDDQLERIKQEVSLIRLAESQGYKPKKHGTNDYAICCPFHDEKTPSCVISPQSNLFNCFGCGAGGSVIDWVMKTQGVSFRHAVEILNETSPLAAIAANTTPKLDAPVTSDIEDQQALQQVIDYYHQILKQSPEALAYLAKRGLDNEELINHFKIGYANRTLGLRLPKGNRKAGKQLREQLQRIGIYRDTGREHFNGSVVFPVMSKDGRYAVGAGRAGTAVDTNNVIGGRSQRPASHGTSTSLCVEVYGRKIRDDLRKGTPKHTYLPGPHVGVFNYQGLVGVEEIILCECIIDALTFWRWGFKNVTCSYGVNGFTDEILQALIDNNVKRVLIAYDRDEAGNTAAEKLAPLLVKNNIDAFRVLLPKNMDVNQYAVQVTPPQKSLALVIRKAEWLGNGKPPERQLALTIDTASVEKNINVPKAPIKIEPNELKELPDTSTVDQNASPLPSLAACVDVEKNDHELLITLENRIYRVRGLENNTQHDQLKINLMVSCGDAMHLDKLDLYSSKQRQVFITQASIELGVKDEVIKKELGKVLLALEEQQAQPKEDANNNDVEITDEDHQAAMALLNDPELLNRVLSDFGCAGVVGEETNKLAGYLSCVSRKLDRPLAVIIQSSSAAGKSSLMDSILALIPEEERVQYSAMTGQSLFYMGETNLKHKILAISEEEGASNASYALKLLQSEGEVTIASTGKDDTTGNLVTKEYKVQGPVMLFLTTTAIDIDEELMNRCLVLSVNESREQTQAIHAAQRAKRTLQGLHNKLEKERVINLHRNAQRLLKPLQIINPYADQLTFLDDKTRTRRDHEKYLTLIDSIALLHQYQREIKTVEHDGSVIEYIEVTLSDIETANRLAHEVLGRTLDELPPQTRKLLNHVHSMVLDICKREKIDRNDYRFSRREVREFTGWGNTQLKLHFKRLEELEYLLVHRGARGQSFVYELLYCGEGTEGQRFLSGLIDIKHLDNYPYDKKKSGVNTELSGSSRPQVAPKSGGSRGSKNADNAINTVSNAQSIKKPVKSTSSETYKNQSYAAQGVN